MLKINLLTAANPERRDAEKAYSRLLSGTHVGDLLGDLLLIEADRTVRRRHHQKLRIERQKAARQAHKLQHQMSRRTGISFNPVLNAMQGLPNRDAVDLRLTKRFKHRDNDHLGEFQGRDIHVDVQPRANIITPEDVDWARKQKSFRRLSPSKSNFCPDCEEYVSQTHQH
jgi:hypothetical protein